ncbi:hypothetical protein [Algoriphagus hitonicola]|uniref:Outer membrane protein beta-barrel domain-containing protein n=1 Tax=Algoriphagus hitonicola TaxID=435880 RepID=A0A1I2R1Z8_9BACT|nr:hypothetical protein [Algoriphagus hitonicola]SFG34528.1 hypothetical protein SAMN04487988_10333 [Algoriphagus hitonicola]
MNKLIYSFLFILISNGAFAQHYGNALGLRLGNSNLNRTVGMSYQHRIQKNLTLEGILQSDFSRNTTAHLLVERHRPILSKRLNYYYGTGLALGREETFLKNEQDKTITHTYGNGTVGVDFILGLEFTVFKTVLSLDYKPNVNLIGRSEFFRGQAGFTARMVLTKSKEQKRKQRQKAKAKRRDSGESFSERFNSLFKSKN